MSKAEEINEIMKRANMQIMYIIKDLENKTGMRCYDIDVKRKGWASIRPESHSSSYKDETVDCFVLLRKKQYELPSGGDREELVKEYYY
jgi:hypothetical protein